MRTWHLSHPSDRKNTMVDSRYHSFSLLENHIFPALFRTPCLFSDGFLVYAPPPLALSIPLCIPQTYIKKVKLWNKDKTPKMGPDGKQLTTSMEAEVWNPSVANLTLMALGSSTPEILLSVIETCASGFYSGDLGENLSLN